VALPFRPIFIPGPDPNHFNLDYFVRQQPHLATRPHSSTFISITAAPSYTIHRPPKTLVSIPYFAPISARNHVAGCGSVQLPAAPCSSLRLPPARSPSPKPKTPNPICYTPSMNFENQCRRRQTAGLPLPVAFVRTHSSPLRSAVFQPALRIQGSCRHQKPPSSESEFATPNCFSRFSLRLPNLCGSFPVHGRKGLSPKNSQNVLVLFSFAPHRPLPARQSVLLTTYPSTTNNEPRTIDWPNPPSSAKTERCTGFVQFCTGFASRERRWFAGPADWTRHKSQIVNHKSVGPRPEIVCH
jgi:hypothetical protein